MSDNLNSTSNVSSPAETDNALYTNLEGFFDKNSTQNYARIFLLYTFLLSLLLILQLLWKVKGNRKNMREAFYLILTILMVPIFAQVSYMGLMDLHHSKKWYFYLLECIKECYEAVVIYFFLQYLYSIADVEITADEVRFPFAIAYELDAQTQKPIACSIPEKDRQKNEVHHLFPMNYLLNHWRVDVATIFNLQFWCFQYVFIRPLVSIEQFYCYYYEVSGGLCSSTSQLFNTVVLNVSITLAVSALLMFKHALYEQIKHKRPLYKFLCIKGVVFISFFQGLVIDFMIDYKYITASHFYELTELSEGIQCFMNLVEMGLIFTIANLFSFDPHEYDEAAGEKHTDIAVYDAHTGKWLRDEHMGPDRKYKKKHN